VFPNPAKGFLSVACENPDVQLLSARLTDLFGRAVVQQFERHSGGIYSMEIPEVSPGAYFLRLETKSGVWVERVMVQ